MAASLNSLYYRSSWAFMMILSLFGVMLSMYAYYVEVNKERDINFTAMCDLSASISCSKVFTSRYGRGFGLLEYLVGRKHWLNQPNSVFGLTFYVMQIILAQNHTVSAAVVQLAFAVVANLGSVYLGYILYFILQDFCVVCVSTYVVNALLLLTTIIKVNYINKIQNERKKRA